MVEEKECGGDGVLRGSGEFPVIQHMSSSIDINKVKLGSLWSPRDCVQLPLILGVEYGVVNLLGALKTIDLFCFFKSTTLERHAVVSRNDLIAASLVKIVAPTISTIPPSVRVPPKIVTRTKTSHNNSPHLCPFLHCYSQSTISREFTSVFSGWLYTIFGGKDT